jgi:hypothetical protein
MIVVAGQSDLAEIVFALRSPGGFAGLLHGGQQQGHQHDDDRNHHQKFDQSKRAPSRDGIQRTKHSQPFALKNGAGPRSGVRGWVHCSLWLAGKWLAVSGSK